MRGPTGFVRAVVCPLVALSLLAALLAGCEAGPGGAESSGSPDAGGGGADAAGAPAADGATADAAGAADGSDGPDAPDEPTGVAHGAPDAAAPGPRASTRFAVRPVVEQLYVWNAAPGEVIEVVGPDGAVIAREAADPLGSRVFRGLTPGAGYVARPAADPDDEAGPLTIPSPDDPTPDEAFYASQTLGPGYQYLTTRDGTTLSVFVALPGPPEDGPYPTLVNYSGYSPSRPGRPIRDDVTPFCGAFPILCDARRSRPTRRSRRCG